MSNRWRFSIDVGGTFTDCVAVAPDGSARVFKTLSSGVTKATAERIEGDAICAPSRAGDPPGFWNGCRLRVFRERETVFETLVADFDAENATLRLAENLPRALEESSFAFELLFDEPAPLLAIRYCLGLRRTDSIPPLDLKLGTTRGTNALLTRTGARTALLTTRGFRDILRIGNQDRPDLFALNIVKPEPLFTEVVEVSERVDAGGNVLVPLDQTKLRDDLRRLRESDIESLAVCLMHAYVNPDHERAVGRIARECGFSEISLSCDVSPQIKIVPRGDTTTLDAYLNPVLRTYIDDIVAALPGSSVQMMTSAGGLVDAATFSGRDSLLSGPAGGVVGFARTAAAAGFEKSIGFDMGGTSTDVARFDGRFERTFESTRAGVRVAAPMLAIETVAAGGGSVCGFDGVRLFVGPASAGAQPGPACYGNGGPLTVTDLNVFLGRIVPDRFPFAIDTDAVSRRLEILRSEVNQAHGLDYSAVELADGLLQIANANMVRAIRRISVARGYDPAEHVLATFGGAGGQHACAIAQALRMKTVLVHPCAGILSAYGIGLADKRITDSVSVLTAIDDPALDLHTAFAQLQQRALQQYGDGASDQEVILQRSADVRSQGLDAWLNVPIDEVSFRGTPPQAGIMIEVLQDGYHALHETRFGYTRHDRPLEVVNLRVELVIRAEPVQSPAPVASPNSSAGAEQVAFFGGDSQRVPILDRTQLSVRTPGPCLITDPASVTVVEPGWSAEMTRSGDLVLRHEQPSARENADQVDPIRLEVLNNGFAAIAEQMGETLRLTSVSTNVKERLDFSCAIFDAGGSLVVNAPHIPVHLGAMAETVRSVIDDNPDLLPGDVYVTNDPFHGGSHLPDVTVVTPVHNSDGKLMFFTASRAHHAEIGGVVPGSMPPFSKTLADEGVLIRNFRLIRDGQTRDADLKDLLVQAPLPSRNPDDNLADIRAQVTANRIGANELIAMIQSEGSAAVIEAMQQIQLAAARKARLAISQISDGTYSMVDSLDDGSGVHAEVTIRGETMCVDFEGTDPVVPSNLNANRAIVTAAVLYVMRCLIREEIPLNAGVLEPVEVRLPPCLLNPRAHEDPAKCAAMVGGNVETSQRVVDVLLGALGLAAAAQGTMNNLTFGNARFGYYETICGGAGATPDADGCDAVHTHMTNTRLTDPEIMEHRYPVRVDEFSIRPGSGGAGRNRGGDGVVRRLVFLQELTVSMLSQRRGSFVPFGLEGGGSGQCGRNRLRRNIETGYTDLPGSFSVTVTPGDVLEIQTPGGGGFGDF